MSELLSVTAMWTTDHAQELWDRFSAIRSEAQFVHIPQEDALYVGPVLPSESDRRIAELIIARDREHKSINWALVIREAPSGEPPKEVIEGDARVGGRQGLASLLRTTNEKEGADVSLRISLHLEASQWACKLLPRVVEQGASDADVLGIGSEAKLEQVGYRFATSHDGIEEILIVYLHKTEVYSVRAVANARLDLENGMWLPRASEIGSMISEKLFVYKGAGHGTER